MARLSTTGHVCGWLRTVGVVRQASLIRWSQTNGNGREVKTKMMTQEMITTWAVSMGLIVLLVLSMLAGHRVARIREYEAVRRARIADHCARAGVTLSK